MLLFRISGMEMKISNDVKEDTQSQRINASDINFTRPLQIVRYFYIGFLILTEWNNFMLLSS